MEVTFCRGFSQRTGLKINLFLSVLLNLSVAVCAAAAFGVMVQRYKLEEVEQREEGDKGEVFRVVMLISAVVLCYSVVGLTVDSLALMAVYHRNHALLLPWLAWGIMDAVSCLALTIMTLVHTLNGVILLLSVKIVWTLFIWINMRELYHEHTMHCQDEVLY